MFFCFQLSLLEKYGEVDVLLESAEQVFNVHHKSPEVCPQVLSIYMKYNSDDQENILEMMNKAILSVPEKVCTRQLKNLKKEFNS